MTCDSDCTGASCGDEYVNGVAGETCDDGNLVDTDACVSCQEASCGDGFIHEGEEECDDGNDEDGDGCSGQCEVEWRAVFVTSESYTGDLGGLEGADAKCQARAEEAGLVGVYKAWLSVPGEGPSTRFTTWNRPYRLVDGTIIADNWADLTDGSLDAPIDRTELSSPAPTGNTNCGGGDQPTVWTSTDWDGTPGNVDACAGWTTEDGSGAWGRAGATNIFWTNWCSLGPCSWISTLYCFQQ
jgi:cysteine-rich repeat protein